MERLTRAKDNFPCRLASTCYAEDWIEKTTGVTSYNWNSDFSECDYCPFEEIINHLGTLEDYLEKHNITVEEE